MGQQQGDRILGSRLQHILVGQVEVGVELPKRIQGMADKGSMALVMTFSHSGYRVQDLNKLLLDIPILNCRLFSPFLNKMTITLQDFVSIKWNFVWESLVFITRNGY